MFNSGPISRPSPVTESGAHSSLPKQTIQDKARKHYVKTCCHSECLWKFSLAQCIEAHTWYFGQTALQSREWLRTTITASTDINNKVQLRFAHIPVCIRAFQLMYGFSLNKYYQAYKDAATPHTLITHGNICNSNAEQPSHRTVMHAWVDSFLQNSGDVDPITGNVHIPSYVTKEFFYELFTKDCALEGIPASCVASHSSFMRYFKDNFTHVRFLKHTRLGRCTFCLDFQERRRKITNLQELADFKEAVRQHHLLHSTERTMYESRCKQANQHPGDTLSMIVDCPQGYKLPNKQPVTKKSWNAKRIPVDAVGAICHTTAERHFYFFLPVWAKGPNLIMTVLFLQLVASLTHLSRLGHRPPILWVQLDNTTRENKNKWLLAFFCWLVHCGWFFEVVVSFLPPGHTHVDVDQMFSTLAIWLLTNTVEFITGVVDALRKAFKYKKPTPTGSFLEEVYNWKAFFGPHLHDVHGLTKPHVFLVRHLQDGRVGVKFKKWHSSTEGWVGHEHTADDWIYLLSSFPSGFPVSLQETNLDTEATLDGVRQMMDLSPENDKKWMVFFQQRRLRGSRHFHDIPDDLFDMSKVMLIFLNWFVHNINLFFYSSITTCYDRTLLE
jgi:hypothetical protein